MEALIKNLKLRTTNTGLPYALTVKRGKEQLDMEAKTVLLRFTDFFRPFDHKPSNTVIQTFKRWSKN